MAERKFMVRQQVREINRKLFANDMILEESNEVMIDEIIASIIQNSSLDSDVYKVPTILQVHEELITKETLDKILMVDKNSILVEFNSAIFTDREKTDIVKFLKNEGYKIIIKINKTDTVFTLVSIFADIVKLNIKEIPENFLTSRVTCKKLAYNVTTPEDYAIAEASNMDYYEGTYISPSETVNIDTGNKSEVNFVEVLAAISNEKNSSSDIAKIIQRDSLMSAQIIRLSNSAYFYSRSKIESVSDAITRIGLNNLKRWIMLLQFGSSRNVPEELLQTSYFRAVILERIALKGKNRIINSNDAFLIGLFSTLDILTGHSIEQEISSMNLNEVVEDALIYREGVGGKLLNLVKSYEDAKWDRVNRYIETFNIDKDTMYRLYFDSLQEVQKLWQQLMGLKAAMNN